MSRVRNKKLSVLLWKKKKEGNLAEYIFFSTHQTVVPVYNAIQGQHGDVGIAALVTDPGRYLDKASSRLPLRPLPYRWVDSAPQDGHA